MKRASLAVILALIAAGCGSSSTSAPTTPTNPTFTAQLLPANETPPIANAENVASGNVTITFVTTKDASGAVTSAVGTAVCTLSGLPGGLDRSRSRTSTQVRRALLALCLSPSYRQLRSR